MGWKDIRRRYMRGEGASQSTEDMVARRVLRAIGVRVDDLDEAEREAGTACMREADSTLLERVRGLALQGGVVVGPVRDVKSGREAIELFSELLENAGLANRSLVYRVGDGEPRVLWFIGTSGCADLRDGMPDAFSVYRVGVGGSTAYVGDVGCLEYFKAIAAERSCA